MNQEQQWIQIQKTFENASLNFLYPNCQKDSEKVKKIFFLIGKL